MSHAMGSGGSIDQEPSTWEDPMKLEIQGRLVVVDPDWRQLIEHRAEQIRRRFPEVLRLNITIDHGRHHRTGTEDVLLLAHAKGAPVRAARTEKDVRTAIQAAFDALTVELARHHAALRHVTKRSGARPQGSIKRIFREAGYGFIHRWPGNDVFFHRASLHGLDFDHLSPGTPVEYELEEGRDGMQASSVYPAGAAK